MLPNFFRTASAAPGLIEELWAFAKSAYLDNPLPSIFKERLFVHLSRFCEVRYCIVRHVGFLMGEGRPAGDATATPHTLQQIVALLSRPVPDAAALEETLFRLSRHGELAEVPSPETQAEGDVFDAVTVIFLAPRLSERARSAVRASLGDRRFELITAFLAFVRTAHYWTETHPELAYEPDMVAAMKQHPAFAALLLDPRDAAEASPTMFTDIMERREREEQQAFLLKLSDALRALTEPADITATVTRSLGEQLGASRAYYAKWPPGETYGEVSRDYAPGLPSLAGRYPIEGFRSAYKRGSQGGTWSVEDNATAEGIDDTERRFHRDARIIAWIDVPLIKHGQHAAVLCVAQAEPRHWTKAEVRIVEETAERCWAAVERARAEGALRKSEERLRLAMQSAHLYAWDVDVATGRSRVSANADDVTGFPHDASSPDDVLMQIQRTVLPEDAALLAAALERTMRGEGDLHIAFRSRHPATGQTIWLEAHATLVAGSDTTPAQVSGVCRNITESRRAEAALRRGEERLRQFGEASQDILWIRDATTLQWTYLTPAFEAIYGLGREEALSGDNYQNWQDLIVPEDRDLAIAAIARVRAGEHVTFEYRVRRPSDGTIRWLRNTDFPITDDDGKVSMIGGVGHNVTRMKAIESAVAASEERLRLLMEGIPQLVWRSCDQGLWTWSSPQWQDFTGQNEDQSRGLGWLDVVHPDDHAATSRAWDDAKVNGLLDVEYRIRRATDGAWIWHHTRSMPVRDGHGRILEWLGTSTDIHELRDLQERQKVLVAELQHRTRNLMGVVRVMADKTAGAGGDLPEFRIRFRDRLDALARVQGLLSRMSEHDRVTFDELVETELAAMGGSADRVTLDGPAGVRLRSSTVQTLAMAIHELATNAVKYGALGQAAGRLAISWRLERSPDDDKPWLRIEWTESGVRMPPADAAPQGTGQGRELIERALPYQLHARTSYMLGPDGVRCTISMPVSATVPPT